MGGIALGSKIGSISGSIFSLCYPTRQGIKANGYYGGKPHAPMYLDFYNDGVLRLYTAPKSSYVADEVISDWTANTIYHSGNCNNESTSWSVSVLVAGTSVYSNIFKDRNGSGQWMIGVTEGTSDVAIGTTAVPHKIGFYTASGEVMTVLNGGDVGIGTGSPSSRLHLIDTSTRWSVNIENGGALCKLAYRDVNAAYFATTSTVSNEYIAHFVSNNISRMWVGDDGNIGIGTTSPSYKLDVNGSIRATGNVYSDSDRRLKDVTGEYSVDLDKVDSIPTIKFNWKSDEDKTPQVGTIAQDLYEAGFEEFVHKPEKEEDAWTVDYSKLSVVAIAAIKELNKEIKSLKEEINLLKSKN